MNMRGRLEEIKRADVKKPMPVLSFPCVQLRGMNVKELLSDPDSQAYGMKAVADRTDSFAALGFMDLSLEAEAFGAVTKASDTGVPAVTDILIEDIEAAEKLKIPVIKEVRAGIYIEGIKKALTLIHDRPVLAGVTGSFILAGSLAGMAVAVENPELLQNGKT